MTKTPDGGLSGQTDAANLGKTGNASAAPAAGAAQTSALETGEQGKSEAELGRRDPPEGERRRHEYDRRGDDNRERRPSQDLGPNRTLSGEESKDVVQQRLDKLSARNEEGHEKNMEAEAKKYENAETIEGEDGAVGKPDPKLGREDNGNTPIVNKDGSKTWMPPGVAFAER